MYTYTPSKAFEQYAEIITANNTRIENLKKMTKQLYKIFDQAFTLDPEMTGKIIASFIMGTNENPEFSEKDAYDHFIKNHICTKNLIGKSSKNDLANRFVEDYKNAFELSIKILVRLRWIDDVIAKKPVDLKKGYFKFAGKIIQELNNSSLNWTFMTKSLDRNLRNAASHLDFHYDERRSIYEGKIRDAKHEKIKLFSITPEEFLEKTLPNATNIIQSFVAAGLILYMKQEVNLQKKALTLLE